jgi:hypothetical protein
MSAQPDKFEFRLNIGGVDEELLSQAPEGWLNTAIKFTRSKMYGGLFRGETLPIKFVTKAAYMLRNEFYTKGILANVKNKINLLNAATWQYFRIYTGILDFSTAVDERDFFTVNSISDDFSVQLNANDSTDYAIDLENVPEAIQLELTPLALKEQAVINFNTSPDFRANSFFQITVVNNQQNSVNNSVKGAGFLAQVPAVFDNTQPNWFYVARMNTTVKITGNIQSSVNGGHYQFNIYKTGGTLVRTLSDVTNSITLQNSFNFDFAVKLNKDEKLFFYILRLDSTSTGPNGVNMQSGNMTLSYETISPGTMCKALPASYLFGKLLEKMNTNLDSGPNQPVLFKSDLLTGPLADLVITSSDSIRAALGSLFKSTDTLFPGSYQVVVDGVTYNGHAYALNDIFSFVSGYNNFTGIGTLQKVVSGLVGTVYNPGDQLQAGGKYLVGGAPTTFVTYNSINRYVGEYFDYVLGQNTFTGSSDTSFVEQVGVAPQIITNFKDFYQTLLGVQGGNMAFGIENIPNPSTDPVAVVNNPTVGRCFIENLDYVYRGTIGNLNAGVVDKGIKLTPAIDLMGNTIKCGYRDRQYTALNGYSEVNSQQNYITSLVTPKKEIDLQCVYRADPYGIEEIRVSQNDTAASRSDNDTFMVWKKPNPENTVPFIYYHPLRTEGLMINPTNGLPMISGVDPSYYNWKLSPKSNLLRGGNYLASIFYNMKGYKITLSSALKNTALVTTDVNGLRVAEADPIYISTLPAPLFIPIYASFKPGLPSNALAMIDSVPYGFITFTYNSIQYKMFADTITVDVGQNTEKEFKGLLTPGNDITQLIH